MGLSHNPGDGQRSPVRDLILTPMCELYLAPPHLRHNAEAQARALAAYERVLAGFDAGTLQRGWDKVIAEHDFWGTWPNPAMIAEACRQAQPKPPPPDQEQRRQKALDLAEAYTAQFMQTAQLAKIARREGWSGYLRGYVADAAWVQAQLIAQVKNIGWNARLADGLGRFHSSAEAFAAYRQTIADQVKGGQIRVSVPRARILSWKERAAPDCEVPSPA